MVVLQHIDEDQLELYSFRRLSTSEQDAIEEHLLVCEYCRQQVTGIEELRVALAEGTRSHLPKSNACPASSSVRLKFFVRSLQFVRTIPAWNRQPQRLQRLA